MLILFETPSEKNNTANIPGFMSGILYNIYIIWKKKKFTRCTDPQLPSLRFYLISNIRELQSRRQRESKKKGSSRNRTQAPLKDIQLNPAHNQLTFIQLNHLQVLT